MVAVGQQGIHRDHTTANQLLHRRELFRRIISFDYFIVGIEVSGLTVCPCAQDMVREHSVELLVEQGYEEQEAESIVGLLPMASHNQRGKGTLLVGSDQRLRAEDLLRIAEQSMSSEIYELLKRPARVRQQAVNLALERVAVAVDVA